jgi:hypothetical protein
VEKERGLGLVDQRRDMADVDRLMQVDELPRLAQTVEELAEILLHRGSRVTFALGRTAAAKQQAPPAVNVVTAICAGGLYAANRFPFRRKML